MNESTRGSAWSEQGHDPNTTNPDSNDDQSQQQQQQQHQQNQQNQQNQQYEYQQNNQKDDLLMQQQQAQHHQEEASVIESMDLKNIPHAAGSNLLVEEEEDEVDILDEMEDSDDNQHGNNDSNNQLDPQQGNLLLMKFCPHDSSMLYPKEDKRTKTLRYACGLRHCQYSEETHTSMVYQNIMKQEVKNVLHKVLSAVSDDPALPKTTNENCESCGFNEAVFFQSDTSDVRNDTLALIFVCCSCGHKWVK